MSKARKTVYVESLRNDLNQWLKDSTCSQDRRQGRIDVVVDALHMTGNYHGFRYLMINEVPKGELPGIIVNGTVENTPYDERFPVGKIDPTRVHYF
jgi:hypothetical protein